MRMLVSQKDRYALQAVFELAKRFGSGPAKVGEIAAAQGIPARFLEIILNELKQAGFVAAQRGRNGGFLLARSPETLSVGDVLRHMRGPVGALSGAADAHGASATNGESVFRPMWQKVEEAISAVYDHTTFANLVEEEKRRDQNYVPSYAI